MARKRDLVIELARQTELDIDSADAFVDQFLAIIKRRLIEGDKVRLTGIGALYTKPMRGHRCVKFSVSRALRAQLRNFLLME